jgi:hypothetical protein
MPRHLTLVALALVVFACANQAEKPVESGENSSSSGNSYTPSTTELEVDAAVDEVEEVSEELIPKVSEEDRKRRAALDRLMLRLQRVAYPMKSIPNRSGIGSNGDPITWVRDNIHIVPRENDSLILATFERETGGDAHSVAGLMDLIAATMKDGKIRVIARKNGIPTGEWGHMCPMLDYRVHPAMQPFHYDDVGGSGFRRFGRDVWGWVINSTGGGQGINVHNVSMYALIDTKIVNLGSFQAGDDNSGHYIRRHHTYNSCVYVIDDMHPTVSDLAITWFHTYSGVDSNRRMSVHRYRPGRGYDFSNLPFRRCTHDTNYFAADSAL